MPNLRLPAVLDNLEKLISFISECAGKQGYSSAELRRIELAVEEVLVNICRYAYPGGTGDIEVNCKVDRNSSLIEIIDTGVPFDCSTETCPDIDANVCDRKLGGLGIFLVHKMVDKVAYRREGNKNVLTLLYKPRGKS